MDEPKEILELFGKRSTVIKPGLERISQALKVLGWPCRDIPKVIIGGTNGKGSTSGLLWHMLCACGIRAGYFSSPHLVEFRERITVTGFDVTNNVIVKALSELKKSLPTNLWEELTFFEINTILAFSIFEHAKAEVCVLEVGLGGRLDCTNVYDADLAVITTVGLDHMEFLGNTTAAIAREKAGIMRKGKICLWGGLKSSDRDADTVIRSEADRIGAKLLVAGEDFPEVAEAPNFFVWPNFLKQNFALARAALVVLAEKNLLQGLSGMDLEKVISSRFGASDLPWPVTLTGRFQHVRVTKGSLSRRLLIDVCHNPHGARALARGLEETNLVPNGESRPALISILRDKDGAGIWDALRGKISQAILFQIASERSWLEDDAVIPGPMYRDFQDAFSSACQQQEWSNESQQPWIICGSVAAVGDALGWFARDGWHIESVKGSLE